MKKLDTSAGPGEIKRRDVGWTLMKKLDTSAGPGEIKRREVELDPQVSGCGRREGGLRVCLVRVCVRACVRACVCVCVCMSVRACMRGCTRLEYSPRTKLCAS